MKDAWQGIIGNARVLEALGRVARSASLGHAYLFSGPEGTGKLLASLAFARELNCRCTGGAPGRTLATCDSCRSLDGLSHQEVLVLCDANKPRWMRRTDLMRRLGLGGADARQKYAEAVLSIFEKGFLAEPLPRLDDDRGFDGFSVVTDHLFGRGSVPSKECYTPGPVSDGIRKGFDRGDLSEQEFLLLKELYEYPLSMMPYRGTIPIAYITPRKDWKFTRPIQAFLALRSALGGRKTVIIDDAHKMTAQAQNCLLKTLEEPPPDSLLILVTSDRQALFPTIVSRCQVVSFQRLARAEMDVAIGALVGSKGGELSMLSALSENCPGKLLELADADTAGKLTAVRDFFTTVGQGRLESVFTFSSTVLDDAGGHRKKVQYTARQVLELLIFWITQIVRTKYGLPDRLGVPEYSKALTVHAGQFEEDALLDAVRRIERSFDLAGYNVDMGLLLHTTLLSVAGVLSPAAQKNT